VTYTTQVWSTTDDGKNWVQLGTPMDPTAYVATLEAARSRPQRIYVSATRGTGASRTASLFASDDSGTSWVEHPIPIDATKETGAYIAAVDPNDADRVYVRTAGQSQLRVTTDGGKTFQSLATLQGAMTGFALSPDGSKAWIGGPTDGLLEADTTSFSFTQKSDVEIYCLAASATQLWACSREGSGFVIGASNDDGASFEAKLHLDSIHGPLSCPPSTQAAECVDQFSALCSNFGSCGPDAGGPASDSGANGDTPPPGSSSCGCDAVGLGASFWPAALIGLVGGAIVRRRRNRTR
jgi:hypothetical protein